MDAARIIDIVSLLSQATSCRACIEGTFIRNMLRVEVDVADELYACPSLLQCSSDLETRHAVVGPMLVPTLSIIWRAGRAKEMSG